jgi:hypothetical protein
MVDPAEVLIVEPFGFFTREALRAGWYLAWRQLIRVVPLAVGAILAGAGLSHFGLGVVGTLVMGLGLCAASIWAALLVFRLAGQWAVVTYGYPLTGALRVWWAITWRTSVAALVASIIVTPPQFVALSLSASFPASLLGLFGKGLSLLLNVATFVASLFAMGWAMSRVASTQLSGLPLASIGFLPEPAGEPVSTGPVTAVAAPPSTRSAAAVPVAASPAAPPVVESSPTTRPGAPVAVLQPRRAPAGAEAKRQCPKCGLYETERGSVIGWYCTICGWRESRR